MYMKNCPKELKDQIFDENTYDIHGRFAIAYEDGLIDSPVGYAKKQYEKWLKNDEEAAQMLNCSLDLYMFQHRVVALGYKYSGFISLVYVAEQYLLAPLCNTRKKYWPVPTQLLSTNTSV